MTFSKLTIFCEALSMPRHLPMLEVQSRWLSEPLRILRLPSTTFVANGVGDQVLSHSKQDFVSRCLRLRTTPWIVLSDVQPLFDDQTTVPAAPTPAEASNGASRKAKARSHIDYVRRHIQMRQPPKSYTELEGAGYEDYLQNPLQPLAQDLESMTYETFEKCPTKYERYEQALASALTDWKLERKPASGSDGKVVVAVLGAGRGPLVARALSASAETGH